jgi:YegS/Rv2252/BmrU family lipid kinase
MLFMEWVTKKGVFSLLPLWHILCLMKGSIPLEDSMPFRRARLILNPKSGQRGRLQAFLETIGGGNQDDRESVQERFVQHVTERLGRYGIQVESGPAGKTPEETIRTIRASVEDGCDLIVVGGGDGTINVAVNALAKSSAALAVLPLGTSNVYAIQMGIPLKIEDALDVIGKGRVRQIDLGLCDDRYFSCLCGIGYDAHTMRHIKSIWTKLFGRIAYLVAGIYAYFSYSFHPVLLRLDDRPGLHKGYMVLVMNGPYYGGRFIVAPDARVDDGTLDVVIIRDRKAAAVLRYVWGLAQGSFAWSEGVEYVKAERVHVLKRGRLPVEVDGEYCCKSPVELRLARKALRAVVGKQERS